MMDRITFLRSQITHLSVLQKRMEQQGKEGPAHNLKNKIASFQSRSESSAADLQKKRERQ